MFYRLALTALTILLSSTAFSVTPTPTPTPKPTPTPTPSPTRSVTFKWTASTNASVTGYKICWGKGSRNYQTTQDVGKVVTTTLVLAKTQYYVAVAAYDNSQTSSFSDEVVVAP